MEQFVGIEEGFECGRDGCDGWIEWKPFDCICAVLPMPPCSRCTNQRLWCPECGWEDEC